MLADPRADALIDNFAGEWLYTRALADHLPDYNAFPGFDPALGNAMREVSRMFFSEFLHGERGIGDMLSSDFTFVNDRLAEHYAIDGAAPGADFIRVDLKTDQRGGLLTQAAWLTVTSYPARTSPVKRGKWILGQLLCSEPPAPPPGVEGLNPEPVQTGSLRQRMEAHRKDPKCAGCHSTMDPLGFSLENYDGIGAYRTMDGSFPVDAAGELPDGTKFLGAQEMAKLIQADPRYGRCVTDKLFTYALGRAPVPADRLFIEHIEGEFGTHGSKLKELIRLIVVSEPFRMRRGETEPKGETVSPQVVFDLLFDGFDPEATAADKARRLKYRTSILDYTLADAKRLHPKLGVSDQHKLDEYMTGVFELEERLHKTNAGAACSTIPRPPEGLDYPEKVKLMLDLMVLAFQCDATRVISFMLGNAGSGRSYEFLGITGGHHEISHHQGLQDNYDKLEKIDTWEVEQYAYLLEKMDAVIDINGKTLLDNSAVYFSSEIEDGNAHRHTNLPVLLAGSCGGSWATGQHIAYPDGPPLANLFITMLGAVGAPVSTFGDEGTSPLKLA